MANGTKPASAGAGSMRNSVDLLIGFAVVALVFMIIIPISTFILDILMILNIVIAITVMLVTLYTHEPLQFSTFPSMLLVTTVFRLALNIAATRLVLANGYAGAVVQTFGSFVVGSQDLSGLVVGIVIFTIIIVIQFVVITSGAQRVAEVAARFTLDAMPGKQMAIDADLNAGLLSDEDAKARRRAIEKEADFYGSMDGASKFVRGDAIAAIVIVLVNIVAGFFIGVLFKKMDIATAAMTYTTLTIGVGLVTQIPALLLSVGTGIIVTRAASDVNLGEDISKQLFSQPRAIGIGGFILLLMAIIFPSWLVKIPFIFMAIVMWVVSYTLEIARKKEVSEAETGKRRKEEVQKREPENVMPLIQVDTMELEIGFSLIPLVDPSQGGDLLDRVTMLRRNVAVELGLVVPPIRIRDNMQLDPTEYIIKIKGVEVSRGKVELGLYLAMKPGASGEELEGVATKDPAFNLPAKWIKEDEKKKAELKGYTVVDVPSVMSTHVSEIIKAHADELLTRQDVQKLIDEVRKTNPATVEELIPALLSLGDVQKVLQNLLREKVAIRDLVTILETLADYAKTTKETDILTEFVRQSLARYFTNKYAKNSIIYALTLASDLEQKIIEAVKHSEKTAYAGMDPRLIQQIYTGVINEYRKSAGKDYEVVVLCSPLVRSYFRRVIEKILPNLAVLSYNEIIPKVEVRSVGVVSVSL
ncbi:MAG: flagellar biosynthesis protein FlhA [bacterium]